jgi:hypothetical protein
MSPLPDKINPRNWHQLLARQDEGSGYYHPHPSEGEYGVADHSTGLTWWSDPATTQQRIAVFAIVTGVLVAIIFIMFFKIRKLKRMVPLV